jgi:hypothetical protein
MAKKEKVIIGDLNIKLADGKKAKGGKPEQLNIPSPMMAKDDKKKPDMPVVDECIKISQNIENLTAELENLEELIKTAAKTAKDDSCSTGDFVKTVNVEGTNLKIQVQFRDAYSKMDIAMKEPLKQIFADKFPIMFTVDEVTTVRPEMMTELKEKLGTDFDKYFNVEKSVKPTKDFQYNYFLLKKSLKKEQEATVQKVLDACQSNPAIKYPK